MPLLAKILFITVTLTFYVFVWVPFLRFNEDALHPALGITLLILPALVLRSGLSIYLSRQDGATWPRACLDAILHLRERFLTLIKFFAGILWLLFAWFCGTEYHLVWGVAVIIVPLLIYGVFRYQRHVRGRPAPAE